MTTREDQAWQKLLQAGAPTFAGAAEVPYGFATNTLARLRATNRQQRELERLGWRALLASLCTLFVVASLTVGMQLEHRTDLDPGISNIIEIGNVPIS